jgi:ribosome-binding factor A
MHGVCQCIDSRISLIYGLAVSVRRRQYMRKNSVKNNRINEEVRRVMSELIRTEIKDPRIAPMTSVMDVEVAPDLKTCKAWISVLGNEEARKNTMAGLRSAEGFIRMQLAKKVNLRNTPEITFILDESVEYGVNMSKKIEEVMAEDEAKSKEHDSAE